MGVFNTRPRFDDIQIKQLSGDTITLSGTTNISGTFRYIPGATVGYVLRAIDSNGTVGWQPVSVSADTNTFVTGGTLTGNNLILGWNTGGSASAIDLSALSDTTYWTAGTAGVGSIRVTNGGTTDAKGSYSVAQGFDTGAIGAFSHSEGKSTFAIGVGSHTEGSNTVASGNTSHAEGQGTTASGDYSHAEGRATTASGTYSHSEGYDTIASGPYSHAGGDNSVASGTNSFIHSTDSKISANRSVLLGGQNLTGTTTDTVYVPNLTVRNNHILHSDSTLEVVDIPGSFENAIKGSYTEFNWDGITTNILSNSNPSGSTSFLLGNFSTYPTILNHGFLSYYGTGYTRTGTPTTGVNFYRNKMVLKTAGDSEGTVFSNANPSGLWYWESDGNSRMKLTKDGFLGLGLNTNGIQNPSEMLHVNSGDILVENTNGSLRTDIQNSAGPLTLLSGATTELPRFGVKTPIYDSLVFGVRGGSEPTYAGYGKQGDAFIYSTNDNNGLNILSQPGTGTDDYIRFFVGQAAGAAGTPDLYIQGSGSTRGNVGINTDSPSEKLHVNGSVRIVDGTEQNGYVLTCDANGVSSWQASSGGGGVTIDPYYTEPSTLSVTWNVSGNSTNYQTVLTGNTTLNLSNVRNGDYGTIIVEQDGTGSHRLSFGTVNGAGGTHRVVNGGGGSPTLTSNPNAIDILSFTYNGSVMYWTVGNDYT